MQGVIHNKNKEENKEEPKKSESIEIDELKISVRDLNNDDVLKRKLPKNTKGVVVTKISQGSPLLFVSVNDVIVELQKKKVISAKQFSSLLKELLPFL